MAKRKNKKKKSDRSSSPSFRDISRMTVLLVVSVTSLLCLGLSFVDPSKAPILSFASFFYLPLLLANIVLFILALRKLRLSSLIPLLTTLSLSLFIPRFWQMPSKEADPEENLDAVSILSYNVGRFKEMKDAEAKIFQLVLEQNPDIVCLQECKVTSTDDFKPLVKAGYHLDAYWFGGTGLVTLSRMQRVDKGFMDFKESTNAVIYTDYRYKGQTFRVYNCHLESYAISPYKVAKALFRPDSEQMLSRTGEKMQRSSSRRSSQVRILKENVDKCGMPNIICGDFNDTPLSYTYSTLKGADHSDAFLECGSGFGASYRFRIPLFRIDYMFASEDLRPVSYSNIKAEYSDHYPIKARFTYVSN